MKKLFLFFILFTFTLCSCKSILFEPPITKTVIDTIQEPVEVSIPEETEIVLPAETKVETIKETKALTSKKEEILLPPKTEVVLKDETEVEIVKIEYVVLPAGTKVETQKTNFYAVLLYAGIILTGLWFLINKKEKK